MALLDFSGIPYPAMPAEARVALIISKYAMFGMIPLVIPSLFTDLPIPIERIPTHQGTDLAYIKQLASDVGYVFYIDPGPVPGTNIAYWGPEIKVGVPQPALNFDMDAHTNVESLSFNFDTANTTLPIVFIQNSLTKIPIPIPIPKFNPLQPPLGLIPAPITNVTMLKRHRETLSDGRPLGVAWRRRRAQRCGDRQRNARRCALRPVLKARQLVGVRGAGLAFDGLYYVKSVTTHHQAGRVQTEFRADQQRSGFDNSTSSA